MEMVIPSPTVNHTAFYSVEHQAYQQDSQLVFQLKTGIEIVTVLCYCFFLYFVVRIMIAFITTPSINENARYILFFHLLINDSLNLAMGLVLLLINVHRFYLHGSLCFFMYIFSSSTFRITPCNLAFMSLERFVAVCFPLRHSEFCTSQKASVAIGIIWILGMFPCLIESILICSMNHKIFFMSLLCNQQVLLASSLQLTFRTFTIAFTFALDGLIILFTYGKVMMVARKMASGKDSAQKAGTTLMLHAFQLLLCMTSLLNNIIDQDPSIYIVFLAIFRFLAFQCVPRFLSPIIYGLRDELLRKHIKKMYFTKY